MVDLAWSGCCRLVLATGCGLLLAAAGSATAVAEIAEYPAEVSALNDNLGGGPQEIAAGPEGDIWYTDGGSSVYRFSPTDGTVKQFAAAQASAPNDVVAGPDGDIWFSEGSRSNSGKNASVGRIVPATGELTEFEVPGLPGPSGAEPGLDGIAVGPDEDLWFTDVGENTIGRVTTAGAVTQFEPLQGSLGQHGGGNAETAADSIAAGPDDTLWFTEPGSHAIGVVNTKGEVLHQFSVAPADEPYGIAEGPEGDMWFTDPVTPWAIGRITPAGVVTEFPAPSAPWSIVKGPDGNIWFTEGGSSAEAGLGCITPSGQIALHPEPTVGGNPDGIAVGEEGAIWFAELNADKLGRLAPVACGATTTVNAGAVEVPKEPPGRELPSGEPPNSNFRLVKVAFEPKYDDLDLSFDVVGPGSFSWRLSFADAAAAAGKTGGHEAKRCKAGETRHKGSCVSSTAPFGSGSQKVSAGTAEVEVGVAAPAKAIAALDAGRTLHVSGPFTFQSARGGAPVTQIESATIHGHRKGKGKKW